MKTLLSILTIGLLLGFSTNEDSNGHLFEVESGKIVYELTGMMNGTEILYWDDWGNKQRKETYTVMEMMGFKQEQKSIMITIGRDLYTLDPDKKTGTHVINDMFEGKTNEEMAEFGEQMLESMGGVKKADETISGINCQVWEIQSMYSKVWIWKQISLKSKVSIMDPPQVTTAVEIQTDIPISAKLFETTGYKITEMGKVSELRGG
jgi:hypothetical protein